MIACLYHMAGHEPASETCANFPPGTILCISSGNIGRNVLNTTSVTCCTPNDDIVRLCHGCHVREPRYYAEKVSKKVLLPSSGYVTQHESNDALQSITMDLKN